MSVEILSVSLTDESINAIAQAVANILAGGDNWPTTQRNPSSSQNPQDAERSVSGGQGDPWLNQGGTPPQGQQQGQYMGQQGWQQGPQQGQQNNGQQYQGGQQQGGHNCAHGPMLFQPAGTNRNTGESYDAYFKCPLQRGAQGRCRNVYPGR